MHSQARAEPTASPPDLEAFIRVLAEPTQPDPQNPTRQPINIEGVTGTDYELGGQFVFAVEHGREADAQAWLEEAGYRVEFSEDIHAVELAANRPGQLLEVIRDASGPNLLEGRVIRDILIGELTGSPGQFYVQIKYKEITRPG
jgi:hypothetical protein